MDEETREQLKEISANLYICKVAARYVENKDLLDDALCMVIRALDNIQNDTEK